MAIGSEKFSWRLFPGARRQCRQCKREPLKIADIGEHRRLWPSQKTEFLCKACQQEKIAQAIERRRHAL